MKWFLSHHLILILNSTNNIISIEYASESQLIALSKFIKKQKKTKTVIMFPKNQYSKLIEEKLKKWILKIKSI